MTKKPEARTIFKKWKTDFRGMDKRREAIPGNFDQLFFAFSTNHIDFDTAEAYITDAAGVHFPSQGVAKKQYKFSTNREFYSFEEWVEQWKEDIKSMASESFYRWNEIDTLEEAPKKIGGMDPMEYNKYRKYIDSFPTVDLKSIREKSAALDIADDDIDFGDL